MGRHQIFSESKIVSVDEQEDVKMAGSDIVVHDAQIVAVCQLDSYKACLRCKARVEPSSEVKDFGSTVSLTCV